MTLDEQIKELLKKNKPSEVVMSLLLACEHKADEIGKNVKVHEGDDLIGWQESASALRGAFGHITSYGM
jgi:hypothetical protein